MPNIYIGAQTKFLSFQGSKSHTQNLTKAFDGYKSGEDVTLHCRGKTQVKTNKISLLFSSKLFQKIFETDCDCNTDILQEYNVVCPDFDPNCMAKVLELINYGTTKLSPGDDELRTGMISIIQSFQINIHLEPKTSDNIPQKIADMSVEVKKLLQNMDEDIKNTSLRSQNMDDKIEITSQKMTEKCDEIRMSESSEIMDITMQNMFDSIYIGKIPDRLTEIPKSSTDSEIKKITTRVTKLPIPYSCKYCDLRFPLHIGLKQHLKKHLNKSKLYKSVSVVEQQQEEQQQEQIVNDQQDSSLLCPFCDELFKNLVVYQVHLKNHSDDNSTDRGQTEILMLDDDIDMMDEMEINWSETTSQDLTYGTGQNSKKGGTSFSIKCPVCSSGRATYQDLLVHMVMCHYKEKMNQHCDKTQRKCQMCEKQFNTDSNLIRHLVSGKHKVLNKMIPKEMVESLKQIKANIYNKKRQNEMKNIRRRRTSILNTDICLSQGEEEQKEVLSIIEIPKIIYKSGNRKSTNCICPICQCKKPSFCHLIVHIGSVHYKDEVKKFVNKDTRGCSLCKKTFTVTAHVNAHVISHLVQKHKVLSQVLPFELLKELEDMRRNPRKRHSI